MKKKSVLRKVLAVSLSATVLCGTGFTSVGQFIGTSGITVNADISRASDIPKHSVGVVGSFNGWDSDIQLTDANGDGVYEGVVEIDEVTPDMFVSWYVDDEPTGERYLQFKVRLDGGWSDYWGYYEPGYDRVWNSQSNVPVKEAVVGQPLKFTVYFDIKNPAPAALANPNSYAEPESDDFMYLNVYYKLMDIDAGDCDFEYKVNDDNTVTIKKYTGSGGDVIIPDTIDGKSVTSIGMGTFYECTGLTSVIIPDSVTSIGWGAFVGCTGLTSITIGNSVTSIDWFAFEDCTGLTSIVIPDSVTSMGEYVFYRCTGLTSVTIPNSVTEIGWYAFSDCTGLTSIVIPDSVTEIGWYAFSDCTGLTSIVIPDSVTSMGEYVFYRCTGLTSIVIPDSVTSIGSGAFEGCTGLTIYGAKGSYAETYANENSIPFVSDISAKEIVLGETVTVNAKAVKCDDNCTYAVYYKKKSGSKWTTKQDFGTNDTVTIKPAKATDYEICVKVKDSKGKIVKKYFDVKVNAKLANTSTIAADHITLGQQVTVNGLAKGGMGKYQYQVLYKQTSQAKWTTAQDFGKNTAVTFKPAKATTYDVCVKVQDSTGTIVKKTFTVQVNAKLTNTSTISKTQIKKGSTVTVNGSATGGMGDYTYAVLYKQKSQTKWTTKQDFNENSDVSIKPAQATDYDICVKVKDKDGTIVKKYFTVTVTK